jgi:hypothetical protein
MTQTPGEHLTRPIAARAAFKEQEDVVMHSRRVQSAVLGIFMLFSCTPIVLAQTADVQARVREILEQARAALGGEKTLKSVQSLSAIGDFRSGTGNTQATGDVQMNLLLPDKLMRTMKWNPLQDMKVTTIEAMNGSQIWTDSQEKNSAQMPGIGSMGGMGRGGGRRSAGGGGNSGNPGTRQDKGISVAPNLLASTDDRQISSDFACLIAGLLLHLPESSHVEISMENNDDIDGAKADYLKIDIGNGAVIRLAIDQDTHRPLMAAYNVATAEEDSRSEEKQPDSSKSGTTQIQIYFSEYKPVAEKKFGDIWLPHQITKTRNGQTVEDMHIKKFQLNPNLKPKEFEQKHS